MLMPNMANQVSPEDKITPVAPGGPLTNFAAGQRFNRFLRILGPGLITGAADDDPSGIATYSQTGAQFGLGQIWTMLYMLPLMIAIQELCARVGAVTGKGLAAVVRDNYSRKVLYAVVGLVVVANTINIGADLGAMAAATRLVIPISFGASILGFTLIVLMLEVFTSYKFYAKMLKWLALALLAYPITAIISHPNWGQVIHATLVPHFELTFAFLFIITGVLGTTISPYLFFWQASEVVEEEIADKRLAQRGGIPRLSKRYMRNIRLDNFVGMVASAVAAWFIIVTTATVLNANGVTNIATAADAAKALEPLVQGFPNSGMIAKSIFAIGIVGLGLLAVPVLAGSASYALSEAFGWKEGLYRKFQKAHGFYGIITMATLAGLMINFIGIDPVKALVFTAVFNGVASVPLIFLLAKIGRREDIMGEYRSKTLSHALVWMTFGAMALASVAMFWTLFHGGA
jgi:NRAMP (natural resistance-associated macrophage protein)-like metal ion transporter